MKDVIISLRVNENIHSQMKMHDEINWSAVIRKAIMEKMKHSEQDNLIADEDKLRNVSEKMGEIASRRMVSQKEAIEISREIDDIRQSGVFNKGKNSTQIIREWRDKRK